MVCSINRKLLPVKLFYFNFLAGVAVLFPFMPIFFKSIGLSHTQSSVIFGVMPFVGFISRLLLGAFADKYRRHKMVLIICVITHCLVFDTMVFIPLAGFKLVTSQHSVPCSIAECRNSSNENCSLSCGHESTLTCATVNVSSSFPCINNATCLLTCDSRTSQLDNFSVFLILLILNFIGHVFFNGISSIQDTITYAVLGEKGHAYGRQRLWGTVGFGVFAIACGFLLQMSESRSETEFLAAFVLHFVLNVLTALCAIPFRVESDVHVSSNIVGGMFRLIMQLKVAVFLVLVFCWGVASGVIEMFLFWFLEESLGASKLLFGVSLGLQCLVEIPAYLLANRIVTKIGHENVFMIVIIAYAVRLTGYSVIQHAWLTLIFDAFNFITFGLMYSATVQWGTIIAPPGMKATIQCLIGGMYFGIGRGLGSLVAGIVYDVAGPIVMFRSFALFTLFIGVLFAIYQCLSKRYIKALPVPADADAGTTEKLPVGDEETAPSAGGEYSMCSSVHQCDCFADDQQMQLMLS